MPSTPPEGSEVFLSRASNHLERSNLQMCSTRAPIHFLHVGKTGGSAIKAALAPYDNLVRFHDHATRLRDVPEGHQVFFFLRDPVSRFVSSFNSRLRCGRPRYDFPWSSDEAKAFRRFKSANDLAIALSSPNPLKRYRAHTGMRLIRHLNSSYWKWLGSPNELERRTADIFFIGQQEHLETDFKILCNRLGLRDVALPSDEVAMHKTPIRFDTTLDNKAVASLKVWYASDYNALRICRDIAVRNHFGSSLASGVLPA
jgi:hypothetical protein